MGQLSFFDLNNRLAALSKSGDPLVRLKEVVDFEQFRSLLKAALKTRSGGRSGGRPPFDPILMFKIMVVQSLYTLSDDQMEFQIRDRLSFMRFLGLDLSDTVPDGKTIWLYRERLKDHIQSLFQHFNHLLTQKGYLAMGGQIVDATIVKAPRQRMTDGEKEESKSGKKAAEIWDHPPKARQKDTDARWRVKQSKPKKAGQVPLGIPEFGYKNHITACKTHGFVRGFLATHGAQHDGSVLMDLLADNTSGTVWGDSAYATKDNLARLNDRCMTSDLHRRKPQGKPMPRQMAKANSRRSKVRARIEHVFAAQKHRMTLFIRTIGLVRATFKIGLANLVYNMQRLVWHTQKQQATG